MNPTVQRNLSSQETVLRLVRSRSYTALLAAACLVSVVGCNSELNKAAFFGWGGFADTDLEMEDFWDDDHTLSVWFMPQYPRTYMGPILSNSGSATGNFTAVIVGIGGYRSRMMPSTNQPLMIQVGTSQAIYTPNPPLEPKRWYHLAVVREGCELQLYLDGQFLLTDTGQTGLTIDPCYKGGLTLENPIDDTITPVDPADQPIEEGEVPVDTGGVDGSIEEGEVPVDTGGVDGSPGPGVRPDLLRIGRARDGFSRFFSRSAGNSKYIPQFYGFVDDVAVFSRALSAAEIEALFANRRLIGNEFGLMAGWTFDAETPDGNPVPAKLARPIGLYSAVPGVIPVGRTVVSDDRDSSIDDDFLPLPFHRSVHQLPFAPGEPWWVTQTVGMGSHVGPYCFLYDFGKEGGSYGETVYATAPGNVDFISMGDSTCDNASFYLSVAPGEQTGHVHLDFNPSPGTPLQRGDAIHTLGLYPDIDNCTGSPTEENGLDLQGAPTVCCEERSHLHFGLIDFLPSDNIASGYCLFPHLSALPFI